MTNTINSAFRISKMNFIWNVRLNEEKQNFETQLNGVSKVISEMAEDIKSQVNNEELYSEEKEQITLLLKQKEILVQDISINRKENDRYKIELYIDNQNDDEKAILKILAKVLNEKMLLQEKVEEKNTIKYEIVSDDKFIIDIAQSKAIKDGMSVSGDSVIQTRLKDRKISNCNK